MLESRVLKPGLLRMIRKTRVWRIGAPCIGRISMAFSSVANMPSAQCADQTPDRSLIFPLARAWLVFRERPLTHRPRLQSVITRRALRFGVRKMGSQFVAIPYIPPQFL